MSTVSKSFTAVDVSATLRAGAAGEVVTFSLSGTYAAQVWLERATTAAETAWEKIAGPFKTANASVTVLYTTKRDGERLRTRCDSFTSGTAVTSLTDEQAASPAPINVTSATLQLTSEQHAGRLLVLDRAAGIALTLPAATGSGDTYRFVIKTAFTGAASIKSFVGADIMIGHALMGNATDNSVVDWQSVAASTNDTIDLFGTANSTGGLAGQEIKIVDLAANVWFVKMRGDAAGITASPFANTVP